MPRPEGMGTARHAAPTAAAGLGLLRGDNTSLPFLPAASPDSTVSHRHSTALKALTGGREHRSTGTQPREPAHSRPAPTGTAGLPRVGNESATTGDTARHPCAPGGCSCPGRGDTVPHGLCSWPWGGLVPHGQVQDAPGLARALPAPIWTITVHSSAQENCHKSCPSQTGAP